MPTLQSHTHCQAVQSSRTSQSLSKSVSFPTHTEDRKESTIAQHCIRAIAGEVMNLRFMHLIKFCVGGQVIALKSATALILDRCDEIPSGFRHIARRLCRPKPFQGLRTSEGFAKCKTLRKASGRYV